MKRIIGVVLVIAAMVVGCQKKEEPKGQNQPSGNPMQLMEEVKFLQEAARKEPGNAEIWTKLGNALMDSARFNEAVDAYQKALGINPKDVDVRVDLGTCYRNIKEPNKAAEAYRKALEFNPNHFMAHKNLAVVLTYDLRDSAQGIREFEKALELAPNASDAAQLRQVISELKAGK
jgi:tetratricopeptide (TPR) repeat protein